MRKLLCLIACLAGLSFVIAPDKARAQDGTYDVDCAVILCMAGGWPAASECAGAYSYMIDRITDIPPKPPFGFCAMADGTVYESYDLDYEIGSRQARSAYSCPEGGTLYFAFTDKWNSVRAFCYASAREAINADGLCHKVYDGITEASFRQFEADLTVEPGTGWEWKSPRTITETRIAAPASFAEPCGPSGDGVAVDGDEGAPPEIEGCVPAWSPPAAQFCDFAFPIAYAGQAAGDPTKSFNDRVSCGAAPNGGPALIVKEFAGHDVSVMSIGRHAFPEAMKQASAVRLSADFFIPADYRWTFAGRAPIGINVGPWTSGGKTGANQSGSSIRLHIWEDGTPGIYSYNLDRTSLGDGGSKQWGQGVARIGTPIPRGQWITLVLELALGPAGADRDAASIFMYDAEGALIGSATSGARLTYRRAGDTSGFTGAIFDSKLNAWVGPSRNQQYYVRNWQGLACERA